MKNVKAFLLGYFYFRVVIEDHFIKYFPSYQSALEFYKEQDALDPKYISMEGLWLGYWWLGFVTKISFKKDNNSVRVY